MLDVGVTISHGGASATICPFCGAGCSALLVDGTAYPRLHHPISQGALCLRGWSMGELARSPLRVDGAYLRNRGDPLRPARFDKALEAAASRLAAVRDAYGGASVGILGSARITVEEVGMLRRLARAVGTPHFDSLQRLGYLSFPPVDLRDLEVASRLTLLGTNLEERHPQIARRTLRALDRGTEVRVVHARRVSPATAGAGHFRVLPGHELDEVPDAMENEFLLVSSELALCGRGGDAADRLTGRSAMFLSDHVNQRGAVEAGLHPSLEGMSAWEMLIAASEGRLKALLVFGDDPFELFPETAARAFAGAEFTLVVDAVKTGSGRHADIVLPGGLLSEKHGTVVNMEGRAQEVAPVVERPRGWTEGGVATRLAERLGADHEMAPPPPMALCSGRMEPEGPSAQYPFVVALDAATFWARSAVVRATVTAWREARNLAADFPSGCVGLSREDAKELRVGNGAPVSVTGADGSITLPARIDPHALPGVVWVPMSSWESAGTRLGALVHDPALRIPVFRPRAVRLARAEEKA